MIHALGWSWEPATRVGRGDEFWIGVDPEGGEWLIKMRGSFYAIRERAFARLAARLGVRCQQSALVCLPTDSPPLASGRVAEPYQVAMKLMSCHRAGSCGHLCPVDRSLPNDLSSVLDPAQVIAASGVAGALGWIIADFVADLFGANEGSERFLTADHECTLVDNDQHFSVRSTWSGHSIWLRCRDGEPSETGEGLLLAFCESVAGITPDELASFIAVPPAFHVSDLWPLKPILERGVELAGRISTRGHSELRRLNAMEEMA